MSTFPHLDVYDPALQLESEELSENDEWLEAKPVGHFCLGKQGIHDEITHVIAAISRLSGDLSAAPQQAKNSRRRSTVNSR